MNITSKIGALSAVFLVDMYSVGMPTSLFIVYVHVNLPLDGLLLLQLSTLCTLNSQLSLLNYNNGL